VTVLKFCCFFCDAARHTGLSATAELLVFITARARRYATTVYAVALCGSLSILTSVKLLLIGVV